MSVLHSEKTIPKFICTSNIYLGIQITRLLGTGMSVLKENPKAGFRGRGGSQSHGPVLLIPQVPPNTEEAQGRKAGGG